MSVKHQWTVDVAAPLTAEQATHLVAGYPTRPTIQAKAEAIYCRRCWTKYDHGKRDQDCVGEVHK